MKETITQQAEHLTLARYLEITSSEEFTKWQWKERGLCSTAVTEGFVLPNGARRKYEAMEWFPYDESTVPGEIAAVCEKCPVRLQCLSAAIYCKEDKGIWGGYSIKVIRKMRRKIRNAMRRKV